VTASREPFGGRTNVGRSLLSPLDMPLKHWLAARVPPWIGTRHLTLATLPLGAALLICGVRAVRRLDSSVE
jgi:hypothetical protein